jgi:hypothetical protein
MDDKLTSQEERIIQETVARTNEQGWGITFGVLFGVGLFAATAILLLRGGPNVGAHLGLLGVYFPGYSVTWPGAFLGFVYAFVLGYALGRTVAVLYNRLSP